MSVRDEIELAVAQAMDAAIQAWKKNDEDLAQNALTEAVEKILTVAANPQEKLD
jgi:hypothetical protein